MKKNMERTIKIFSAASALLAVLAGVLVIIGWFLDIGALKSVLPTMVTMKFNTAVAFCLTGTSLLILQLRTSKKFLNWTAAACSFIGAMIGLVTFLEYATGLDLGIDQLIFAEPAGALFTVHLGRMAVSTAAIFFLLNTALILLISKSRALLQLALVMAAISGLLSYQALIGYLLGVRIMLLWNVNFTAMALHTAVLFFLLAVSVILSETKSGPGLLICSKTSAGMMFRRLLPMALILPPFFGFLKITTERAGLIPNETGVSLVAIFNSVVFTVLIWASARSVSKMEGARRQEEEEWHRTFDSITDFVYILNKNMVITKANTAFCRVMGKDQEDIVGRKCHELVHKKGSPWLDCPAVETFRDKVSHTKEVNDPSLGIPLLVTTSPVLDENGDIIELVHIAKDITEMKKSQNALADKIREMELLQKLTMGRESRIIELKEEVLRLKKQLEK